MYRLMGAGLAISKSAQKLGPRPSYAANYQGSRPQGARSVWIRAEDGACRISSRPLRAQVLGSCAERRHLVRSAKRAKEWPRALRRVVG